MKFKNKKIRRGGKSRNNFVYHNNFSDLKIYHCNLRGFDSKRASLETIISSLKPNIVSLNETHYQGSKKINLRGYETFSRNRITKGGGGIATAVCNAEAEHALKVSEGNDDNEFMIT